MRDLSEKLLRDQEGRILGEHLDRDQRAEALRALTGAIAHDFNNILTGILGNLQLAEMDLPAGHAAQYGVQASLQACRHAGILVARILAYSHAAPEEQPVGSADPVVQDRMGS
jgi:signal transduction histidine kinase